MSNKVKSRDNGPDAIASTTHNSFGSSTYLESARREYRPSPTQVPHDSAQQTAEYAENPLSGPQSLGPVQRRV